MTSSGRQSAILALETLAPDGTTNLWDGLHTGLEVLRRKKAKGNSAVFLLTDGMPNIVPPRGHVQMLQRYKNTNKDINFTLNTFGFGYDLDSKLLDELATEGNGTYSFIPDSSFVGTIFVNSLSNILVTTASSVFLTVEPLNGATFDTPAMLATYQTTKVGTGIKFRIGTVQYGQSRDVVIPMNYAYSTPFMRTTLEYICAVTGAPEKIVLEVTDRLPSDNLDMHYLRLKFVETVRRAMAKYKSDKDTSQNLIKEIIKLVGESSVKDNELVADILKDLEDQVSEAFSCDANYDKWGKHYLPSLTGAHLHQQCNNFKDPGVQHYGGDLFEKLRDQIDDVFNTLPPPKPSKKAEPASAPVAKPSTSSSTRSHSYSPSSPAYSPVPSMAVYNTYYNPCFDGASTVLMENGELTHVKNVRKGDIVANPGGLASRVLCVVKTICSNNKTELVELEGGLKVTPYHPVRVNGKWCFPRDLGVTEERACPAVFSFVLEENHVMIISGTECVTLAHGFTGDRVVEHPYFGTRKVLRDLEKMQGWEDGLVELRSCFATRDENGFVNKIYSTPHGPVL
jgi:hypothetical protein